MFIIYKYFLLIKNDFTQNISVLLFEAMFGSCQKLIRKIKQARLVNIVLDAAMKRTHELQNGCI